MSTNAARSGSHFTPIDLAVVQREAASLDTARLLQDPQPQGVSRAAVALALFNDTSVSTADLKGAAIQRVASRRPALHTFVPLYLTNYCESECKMCGMRRSNAQMVRKFSGKRVIEEQLTVLRDDEHVRGVGFLTGEYGDEYTRLANAFLVGWAIRKALDMGFQRIYFNIGSMTEDEIGVLGEWITPDEPVTMCVFQETYDRPAYARFMGTGEVPKSNYDRRVTSFDRWLDAGFRHVNPGALVGLAEVETDLVELVAHAEHLAKRGAEVDLSLPRLRPAMGVSNKTKVDDDTYLRVIAALAFACPDQRVVVTNREDRGFRDQAIDMCGVISPGSPDVAPYSRYSLSNAENTSQFKVGELSRPSQILTDLAADRQVVYFEPPAREVAHSAR